MVIDDEEFCLTVMSSMLFKIGVDVDHRVDFFNSGEQAVTQLKKAHQVGSHYSIIFTDFNMPKLTGIQATSMIRQFISENGLN